MVTFCIIHMGNRKIFLKHHSPEFQLILLHVSVFSYFLHNICEKLVGTPGGGGGGMMSNSPKCYVWAFGFLVCSLENLFSSIMK